MKLTATFAGLGRNDLIIQMSTSGEFVLGQYKIGKSIGQGTFGKVRLGIHLATGQKVAVKTLQKEKIVEQADIERVTREICILKVLRHPNIIQLYEIIQTKTDIHLIMEYAEGGELFDYIVKRKRLEEKEAVAFMHQIISGVQYIHKNGIVHRDLKPQNLLLDHNRNIKIVDFGLSNQYKPGEKLKTACGSPCYASPQMIAGKRYECLGTDLWSCGIILYAMLCGYLPFQDPNTSKLYKKIMAGEYDVPKILSPESKDLLRGILSTNPETRFKLQQIRQSQWFNQLASVYSAEGTIVGKDQIEVDERLLRKMQPGHDLQQARTYVLNNRHNQTTALYYLLKIKAERDPEFLQTQEDKRRQESPLVYRPQAKKEYYLPIRPKPKDPKEQDKNDSMNVSNIISSLVEANKAKIVNRVGIPAREGSNPARESNFDKLEDFKLFPNKKNSSIYEPKPQRSEQDKSIETARERNRTAEKSLEPRPKLVATTEPSSRKEDPANKKRQELSDQLRQISIKIDQEIHELRKQNTNARNNSTSSSVAKKRESLAPSSALSSRIKTQQNSVMLKSANKDPPSTHRDSLGTSRDPALFASKQKGRQVGIKAAKIHSGPFNSQCVFMESAKNLLERITGLLLKLNMRYQETEAYSIFVSGGPHIAIECLQGIAGMHLVKFQSDHPINAAILQVLAK